MNLQADPDSESATMPPSPPEVQIPTAHPLLEGVTVRVLLMIKILHYLKDPKLWELWYIPNSGQCRIYIINRGPSS